jgi:hypothetical protein
MVVPPCACPANSVQVSITLQVGARVLQELQACVMPASLTVSQIWKQLVSNWKPEARPRYFADSVARLKACGGGRILLVFGNGRLQDVHATTQLGQLAVNGSDSVSLIFYVERSGLPEIPVRAVTEKNHDVKKLETIDECDSESTDCECEGESSESSDGERGPFRERVCPVATAHDGTRMTWRL